MLLDTAFAKPSTFKKLCKKSVVKHVRLDFDLPRQAEDEEIYNLAVKNKMFVVTLDNDFKKFVRQKCPGVLIMNSGLTNEQIDIKLTNFISSKNPLNYYGKTTKV